MINDIKETLVKKNISPSYHRLKIYEYLVKNHVHPTVEKIYGDLIPDIPTLSKTTIYNTLKSLIDKGLVIPVTIENNEVRYDADISIHGHFKCTKCGEVYDIDLTNSGFAISDIDGHRVTEHHFNFKGICKNCLSN